jgi:hypothetical protein
VVKDFSFLQEGQSASETRTDPYSKIAGNWGANKWSYTSTPPPIRCLGIDRTFLLARTPCTIVHVSKYPVSFLSPTVGVTEKHLKFKVTRDYELGR